jgi:sortase A
MKAWAGHRRRWKLLRAAEIFFWVAGAILLGCYAFVYLDRSVYQAYQEWAFDRRLQNEPAPVPGFVLHALGNSQRPPAGEGASAGDEPAFSKPVPPQPAAPAHKPRAAVPSASIIGRIEISSAGVRAIIVDGTANESLRRAVGHIEGTALPGEPGNVGLAGHRDTFFRGLRNVQKDDAIVIRTLEGTYEYRVSSLQIVGPDDVEVLQASAAPTLTLVTCYPFDYVGPAPRRFVVQAREVSGPGITPRPPRGS